MGQTQECSARRSGFFVFRTAIALLSLGFALRNDWTDSRNTNLNPLCSGEPNEVSLNDGVHEDLAQANLLCAVGLPGADGMECRQMLVILDEWLKRVAVETQRYHWKFKADPAEFNHSEGYFRILTMVTVLQQDFGVRYNPERIRSPNFADSRDLFIHGLLTGKREGTCVSMPVLYVAIGRRLGYPLRLVTAKGHLFARWEGRMTIPSSLVPHTSDARGEGVVVAGPFERFNIEATSVGLNCFPDEYYHIWPERLTLEEIARGQYLRSLTAAEEFAVFLSARGNCLEANGRFHEAQSVYAQAHHAAPETSLYLGLLARVERKATQRKPSSELRVGQTHIPFPSQYEPLVPATP